MAKFHQLLALVGDRKATAQSVLTKCYQLLDKSSALFTGVTRVYEPKDDDGEKLPGESQRLQRTVDNVIDEILPSLVAAFDAVASVDSTNCAASAPITVAGQFATVPLPATYFLYLEKQLEQLKNFISKLPVLDAAKEWEYDPGVGAYRAPARGTVRTKKVEKPLVTYQATEHHPAQVVMVTEDINVGTWVTTDFSGAVTHDVKKAMLERLFKLVDAVKFAREEANSATTRDVAIGESLLNYVFRGKLPETNKSQD